MQTFDHIVIGAGSAGSVLAGRLSADGSTQVLVIEAGGSDRRFWIRTPIGYGKTLHDPSVNWCYRSEPDPGLKGRPLDMPRGKVLGGSSSINAMVYHRGLPQDFEDWRGAGNPGWGWADLEPVFARTERHVGAAARGSGPLWITTPETDYHPIRRHFLAAAAEIGLPLTSDMNGPAAEGVGPYALTIRGGRRWSAADAFLHPARGRRNLAVLTGARVTRILIEDLRATGVEIEDAGGRRIIRARREVLVAAGAINTPQLLLLSGLGPGAQLQALGLPVLRDLAGVGANLQDHFGVNYAYRATEPTLNGVLGTWPGRLRAGSAYLLTRGGPLALSVNQMGGLVRSTPAAPRPDIQLYFNPLSYSAGFAGERPLLQPDSFPGFILGFNPARPTSAGRITLASPDPLAAPRIAPNALATEADCAAVLAGARLVGRLQDTAALRRLIDGPAPLDLARLPDDAILEDFRARAGTVYHPCGTCRMAPLEAGGVVDPHLRVHGVAGLRVVDASVFPNITSANTNAPTIALAQRAADLMAAEAR